MLRDQEILREILTKNEEIKAISTQMISGLQMESREKIENLQREIEALKKRLGEK